MEQHIMRNNIEYVAVVKKEPKADVMQCSSFFWRVLPLSDPQSRCRRCFRHSGFLAAMAIFLAPPAIGGVPAPQGFIEHYGYEQIIAGPNVPDAQGFPTDPAYAPRRVALSEDGARIWFTMFNRRVSPEYLIAAMLTDGTGERLLESFVPGDDYVEGNTVYLDTSADGDRAVFWSSYFSLIPSGGHNKVSTATLPAGAGNPVSTLFADVTDRRRDVNGAFRLTDDGSKVLFVDRRARIVGSFDTTGALVTLPTVIADRDALAREGNQPSKLVGFDMSGNGGVWWTFAFDNYNGADRFWLNRGAGTVSHESLPLGDQLWSDWIEVSDDGRLLVYCPEIDSELNNPQRCYIQESGTSGSTPITGDQGNLGQPVLADGGDWVYVQDEWNLGTSYGYRVCTSNPDLRRVAGTQWFSNTSAPEFSGVRLSDDGRVLAAPVENFGIYVQHDGVAPPLGFPALTAFSSRYDSTADELVVEVTVAPSSPSLNRIYTLPLYRGIEPTRILPEEDNPLHRDRNGGGVNANTFFTQIGTGNVWERRIPMDGKFGLLNPDFAIRIVAVDDSRHRTSYYDFVPSMIYDDGFESVDFGGCPNGFN